MLEELQWNRHSFHSLSAKLVVPFDVGRHETFRAEWNKLVEEQVIVPVETASTVPLGPLAAPFALAV
jgi:hypothetical protein